MAVSSVDRERKILVAVVNKALLELDLTNLRNPFEKLEFPKDRAAKMTKKLPLSDEHMASIEHRLANNTRKAALTLT